MCVCVCVYVYVCVCVALSLLFRETSSIEVVPFLLVTLYSWHSDGCVRACRGADTVYNVRNCDAKNSEGLLSRDDTLWQ